MRSFEHWRHDRANRLPRKPFLAQRDTGYYRHPEYAPTNDDSPTLMFQSGPFERRRFHTEAEAQEWAGPEPIGRVYQLHWHRIGEDA
jgi:hypothetical protein